MRLFEILSMLVLSLTLISFFVSKAKRPRWMSFLPGLVVIFALIHLILEGYRWQMVPAYVLSVITVLVMVRSFSMRAKAQDKKFSRFSSILIIAGTILGLLMLIIGLVLCIYFPIFSIPEPTGPYAVGTRYFYWVDENRPDTYTETQDDYREVSVQIWYPAELSGAEETISYMKKEAARAFAGFNNIPYFIIDHLQLVRTHSYMNADLAEHESPFPIITYSTSGLMSSHMTLFEELASQGYVVLCIGHPYWNPFVYGGDGEIIPFDGQNEFYQAWWDEENAAVKEAKWMITTAKTTEEQENAQYLHNELKPIAIRDLKNWAEDIGFVLDELEKMNKGDDFLAGSLNMERIGIIGFSKGGAA
ncbi:MAG: hypothetical protein MUO76_14390, partial [Anaerolineaceae bacterium]|nr:hypothetical protein [Anaerolineaceae bacterium]